MYGKEGLKLINELVLSDEIKPFNDFVFKNVLDEMKTLTDDNYEQVRTVTEGVDIRGSIQLRHNALERNKRLLLTYVSHRMERLKKMRWELGSILPPEIKANLIAPEEKWFNNYNKALASYMRTIGDGRGLNIMKDMVPPKSLYVEVRCLVDYGKFEFEDGQVVNLKKNTHHLLPSTECETLIRQGILEHVTN
ncbi:DNA replication complex GINS protein PSF1-like [Leptopilina heterotoma]|uniref:DNA replication complex GINS protein PSF1-like n=1 Tax=Leptopilina heterotoma TaxID=63436 RepID=UPI001CA7DA11|nr:DNA replication complex GINS protein PSF1-like [Leptopilina heterotoma]